MAAAQSNEGALDEKIKLIERATGQAPRAMPSAATSRGIVREMLSLPPGAPIDATDDELRVFGKICYLLSVKRKKWISASLATFPHDANQRPAQASGKFLSRLEAGPSSRRSAQGGASETLTEPSLLSGHSDLVEELFQFVPKSEADEFRCIVPPFNASAGEFGAPVYGLPSVRDARAWMTIRAVQQYIYTLSNSFSPCKPPGWTGTEMELRHAAAGCIRHAVEDQAKDLLLRWRGDDQADHPRDSLYSRLLVNIALNRFLICEIAIDRHASASAGIQVGLLSELMESCAGSVGQLVSQFQRDGDVDYLALTQHALGASIARAGRGIGGAVARRIEQQVAAIMESCRLREFEGEAANAVFAKQPAAARAIGWLVLSWAFLNQVTVPNEDPEYNSPNVLLVSERSKIHTHGQGMILRRRLISSLLASQQYEELAMDRLALQQEFTSSIRQLMFRTVTDLFRGASLTTWKTVFDHFDCGKWGEHDLTSTP